MKKRCIALIAALAVITGTFAGCGKDSDSSDKAASTSASTTAETTEAEETEETEESSENDAVTTTKAASTKAASTKSAFDAEDDEDDILNKIIPDKEDIVRKVDISEAKGGDIEGTWQIDQAIDDFEGSISFDESGKGSICIDIPGAAFGSDGSVSMEDLDIAAEDIIYDGKTIDIRSDIGLEDLFSLGEDEDESKNKETTTAASKSAAEKTSLIQLERVDGSTDEDSMNGEYKISGGALQSILMLLLSDELSGDSGNLLTDLPLHVIISDEKIGVKINDAFSYEVTGSKLKLTPIGIFAEEILDSDTDTPEVYFTVDGDTLTLINTDGEAIDLSRS